MLLLWICLVCGFSPALSTCRWDQETLRCNGDDGNVRHTPKLREIQRVEMVRVKKISFAQTDVPNLRYLAIKDSPTLSCRNFTNWMLDINVTITINDRKCKNVVTTLLPKTMRTKSPRKVWKTKSTTQSTTLSTTDWTNNTTLSTTTSSSLEPFNLTPQLSEAVLILTYLVIGMFLGAFFTGFGVALCLKQPSFWNRCWCRKATVRRVETIRLQNTSYLASASGSDDTLFTHSPLQLPDSTTPRIEHQHLE
ncbi:uncharacterized protein [Magallana gigas]|uniref:uncharacterized protein n=1 Tax=Magallana gigas TaxID=29159 RepID=UPI00333F9ABC